MNMKQSSLSSLSQEGISQPPLKKKKRLMRIPSSPIGQELIECVVKRQPKIHSEAFCNDDSKSSDSLSELDLQPKDNKEVSNDDSIDGSFGSQGSVIFNVSSKVQLQRCISSRSQSPNFTSIAKPGSEWVSSNHRIVVPSPSRPKAQIINSQNGNYKSSQKPGVLKNVKQKFCTSAALQRLDETIRRRFPNQGEDVDSKTSQEVLPLSQIINVNEPDSDDGVVFLGCRQLTPLQRLEISSRRRAKPQSSITGLIDLVDAKDEDDDDNDEEERSLLQTEDHTITSKNQNSASILSAPPIITSPINFRRFSASASHVSTPSKPSPNVSVVHEKNSRVSCRKLTDLQDSSRNNINPFHLINSMQEEAPNLTGSQSESMASEETVINQFIYVSDRILPLEAEPNADGESDPLALKTEIGIKDEVKPELIDDSRRPSNYYDENIVLASHVKEEAESNDIESPLIDPQISSLPEQSADREDQNQCSDFANMLTEPELSISEVLHPELQPHAVNVDILLDDRLLIETSVSEQPAGSGVQKEPGDPRTPVGTSVLHLNTPNDPMTGSSESIGSTTESLRCLKDIEKAIDNDGLGYEEECPIEEQPLDVQEQEQMIPLQEEIDCVIPEAIGRAVSNSDLLDNSPNENLDDGPTATLPIPLLELRDDLPDKSTELQPTSDSATSSAEDLPCEDVLRVEPMSILSGKPSTVSDSQHLATVSQLPTPTEDGWIYGGCIPVRDRTIQQLSDSQQKSHLIPDAIGGEPQPHCGKELIPSAVMQLQNEQTSVCGEEHGLKLCLVDETNELSSTPELPSSAAISLNHEDTSTQSTVSVRPSGIVIEESESDSDSSSVTMYSPTPPIGKSRRVAMKPVTSAAPQCKGDELEKELERMFGESYVPDRCHCRPQMVSIACQTEEIPPEDLRSSQDKTSQRSRTTRRIPSSQRSTVQDEFLSQVGLCKTPSKNRNEHSRGADRDGRGSRMVQLAEKEAKARRARGSPKSSPTVGGKPAAKVRTPSTNTRSRKAALKRAGQFFTNISPSKAAAKVRIKSRLESIESNALSVNSHVESAEPDNLPATSRSEMLLSTETEMVQAQSKVTETTQPKESCSVQPLTQVGISPEVPVETQVKVSGTTQLEAPVTTESSSTELQLECEETRTEPLVSVCQDALKIDVPVVQGEKSEAHSESRKLNRTKPRRLHYSSDEENEPKASATNKDTAKSKIPNLSSKPKSSHSNLVKGKCILKNPSSVSNGLDSNVLDKTLNVDAGHSSKENSSPEEHRLLNKSRANSALAPVKTAPIDRHKRKKMRAISTNQEVQQPTDNPETSKRDNAISVERTSSKADLDDSSDSTIPCSGPNEDNRAKSTIPERDVNSKPSHSRYKPVVRSAFGSPRSGASWVSHHKKSPARVQAAKRKSMVIASSSDEEVAEPRRAAPRKKRLPPGRRKYDPEEKEAIVEYIESHKSYGLLMGRSIWQTMEAESVCKDRTWQSMKEHYLKKILPNIQKYASSEKTLGRFRERSQSNEVNTTKPKPDRTGKRPRPYSTTEDVEILKYVMQKQRYKYVKGNKIWHDMANRDVVPDRTWQSLKTHYNKAILEKLNTYSIAENVRKVLLRYGLT